MPDISSLNGKLIYQLTSASALKDTDLFAISSNNLTRSVSLLQIKLSMESIFYTKNNIDGLLDDLRGQIKKVSDEAFETVNDITEFRNEFNSKLQNLNQTFICPYIGKEYHEHIISVINKMIEEKKRPNFPLL